MTNFSQSVEQAKFGNLGEMDALLVVFGLKNVNAPFKNILHFSRARKFEQS